MQTTLPTKLAKPGRVRSALLHWLGVPIALTDGAFWQSFASGGVESSTGENVTANTSLKLSTVWRCVRLLSESVACMPFKLHWVDKKLGVADKHPLYSIIHTQPNADMVACTFWEVMMTALTMRGNAYAEIVRAAGQVIALVFIHPDTMQPRRRSDGSIEYRWTDELGRGHVRDEMDVLHVPGFTLNGLVGVSPITYASEVFGNAMAAARASGAVFKHGLIGGGTFETENVVKESLRDAFQERIKAYQGAIAAGKSPLLEGGIKFKPISMNPDDAQLLEARGFSVEEICRWYGVPPPMVGHTTNSTSWGTGLEQQKLWFLAFGLQIWLTRIQQQCNRKLLSPADKLKVFCEFDSNALLRTDSAARAAFYSTLTQNGVMTRDEVREKENMPAMGGNAAVLTVQSALVPLNDLGKSAPPPAQSNPLALHLGINMPEQKAPTVTMHHTTPVNVRTPDVRVEGSIVNVPEQPAPQVTINQEAFKMPAPTLIDTTAVSGAIEFTYDSAGDVTGARFK